jgi:hypothetical protein
MAEGWREGAWRTTCSMSGMDLLRRLIGSEKKRTGLTNVGRGTGNDTTRDVEMKGDVFIDIIDRGDMSMNVAKVTRWCCCLTKVKV